MESKHQRLMKVRSFFISPGENNLAAFKELYPFFLMVTFVLLAVYFQTVFQSGEPNSTLRLVVFTLLMSIHILVYWMCFRLISSNTGTYIYLLIQGVLVFLLVIVSQSPGLAVALYAMLAGNTTGLLGNRRISLLALLMYITLAILNISLVVNFSSARPWFITSIVAIFFSALLAWLFNRLIEARTRAQTLLEELEEAHAQLAKFAIQVEELTLTTERQRMARELHDTLAQGLAGLILQLEAVDVHLEHGHAGQAQEILHQAMSRARTTLVDARRAIDDLRAGLSVPRELVAALEREARRFDSATGITCSLTIDLPDQLPQEYAEHILRIVSEGLGNIARHAQARCAQVTVANTGETIDILIQDDGKGFDPQVEIKRAGHYGLLGIRERVRLAGGDVDFISAPGRGAQLQISLPLTSHTGAMPND